MSSRLCVPFPGKGKTEAWLPPIPERSISSDELRFPFENKV